MKKALLFTALIVLSLVACGEDGETGEGTLAVEIWGEDFIEQENGAEELDDDFSVTFDAFLVAISNVSVAEEGESAALEAPRRERRGRHAASRGRH